MAAGGRAHRASGNPALTCSKESEAKGTLVLIDRPIAV